MENFLLVMDLSVTFPQVLFFLIQPSKLSPLKVELCQKVAL